MKTVYPADRYQDVFGQVLTELAQQDEKVVGITPAMASGCGMTPFAQAYPNRFFDVGIEEGHAVTFSAGLAAAGMKPYCNIYSSFSQRAYDNIIHDVALQNLPVVFCFDRGGLVGEDGATHHGCFDMAAYRSIPGITIAAPRNETELKRLMYTGLSLTDGPMILRYPRGVGEGVAWREAPYEALPIGRADKVLGTTYALINWVQNLGLLSFKWLSGVILGTGAQGPVHVEMMFSALCVLAVVAALLFRRTSARHPELQLDKANG